MNERIKGAWSTAAIEFLESRRLLAAVYLSDLAPAVTPTNGWGPVEKDHSNGESGANDGKTLTLNLAPYSKGLGVHAASEIAYDFNASSGYSSFQADIGVDDEVGSNGSVVFQVWLDNTKVFDSGLMTGSSATQAVNVNIANITARLRLIVTNGGNGNTFDHADWAIARFVSDVVSPPSVIITRTGTGDIAENGGSTSFLISRQGSTSGPLTVNISAGGSATRDADYVLRLGDNTGIAFSGNTVTIPNGATSVQITASSLQDNTTEGNESIFVGVASGNGYTVGGPSSAGTHIVDADQTSFVFLSDLPIASSKNGWGPIELDRSNGETGPNDGHTLTMDGKTYAKGLGTHAASEINFNLGGKYTSFTTIAGIDDEVGNNGSAVFLVFVENVLIFNSGVRTGSEKGLFIAVDLRGANQLKLVVLDGGDGTAFDHADWADAKVVPLTTGAYQIHMTNVSIPEGTGDRIILEVDAQGAGPAPLEFDYATFDITAHVGEDYSASATGHMVVQPNSGVTSNNINVIALNDKIAEGNETFGIRIFNVVGNALIAPDGGITEIRSNPLETPLSFLTPASQTNGWGPIEKNRSNGESGAGDGETMKLNGTTFSSGIGVHAGSDLTFNIANQNIFRFTSAIGVDDEVGNNGSVVFQVYVDGQKKFDSGTMTGSSPTQNIDLSLTGASTLRLVVTDAGNGNAFDHADWAGALLNSQAPI